MNLWMAWHGLNWPWITECHWHKEPGNSPKKQWLFFQLQVYNLYIEYKSGRDAVVADRAHDKSSVEQHPELKCICINLINRQTNNQNKTRKPNWSQEKMWIVIARTTIETESPQKAKETISTGCVGQHKLFLVSIVNLRGSFRSRWDVV